MSSMFYCQKNECIVLVGQMCKAALCDEVRETIQFHDK